MPLCPGARITAVAEWLRVGKTRRVGDRAHPGFDFPILLDPYANGGLAVCRGPSNIRCPWPHDVGAVSRVRIRSGLQN